MSGVAFVHRDAIVTQLGEWRLLPEPERVTELYFTDYTKLPKSLAAGSHHTVTFTVHNLEHQPTVYHYRLLATSEQGAEQSLGNGTFMLSHGKLHQGSADIVVPAPNPRLAIKIELYHKSITQPHAAAAIQTQSINFWTEVTHATATKAVL